jgi:pyruvate/2-oxoglutarate dehydrogenase complex dihydrolipoamide acyltransferase (E2) component
MTKTHTDYQVVPFPGARYAILDYLHMAHRKHIIHGLIELDVTVPRQVIREHKARTGESLSFAGFIIACLACAVDENKAMHAYRRGNQLILFDDVDVNTLIEHDVEGVKIATPYVLRAANKKTFREIHQELRAAQAHKARDPGGIRRYHWLPGPLRRLFWWAFGHYPHLKKRIGGTVSVTALNMFGAGTGWAIPITDYTLGLALGGIAHKPGVADGRIAIREILCLTLSVDHDVVDGAPAARFVRRLKELVESGYGLAEAGASA